MMKKKNKRHLKSYKHKNNLKLNEKDNKIKDLTIDNLKIKRKK